jgi:hypothetical protein
MGQKSYVEWQHLVQHGNAQPELELLLLRLTQGGQCPPGDRPTTRQQIVHAIDWLLHVLSPNQTPYKQEDLFVKVDVLAGTNLVGFIAAMD